MSESKLAPGPWGWEYSRIGNRRIALSNESGQDILTATKDIDGHAFIDISDDYARLLTVLPDLLAALEVLFSNPHVDLGDLVYQVRDREGKGWDGEAVHAWSDAVMAARAAIKKVRGGDR